LTLKGSKGIIIKNAFLIDGTGSPPVEDGALLIEGNKIAAVGPSSEVKAPSTAKVLDVEGKTIMPGLIDLHLHLAGVIDDPAEANYGTWASLEFTWVKTPMTLLLLNAVRNAKTTLESGFTTIREMLGYTNHDNLALRKAVELGLVPGPRIFTTGSVNQKGGQFDLAHHHHLRLYAQPPDWTATGPWECRRKVRDHVGSGHNGIKTIAGHHSNALGPRKCRNFTMEELTAITDEAHAFGLPVTAHCSSDEADLRAVEAGIDSIDHGIGLGEVIDDKAVEAMRKSGTIFIPTLMVMSDITIEEVRRTGRLTNKIQEENRLKSVRASEVSLKKAYDAGVKIACGTDIYTTLRKYVGKSAYELELMVRYGMSEMDAIKAATKTASEALWWQDRVGTLEVGKLADVLVVDGNPLKDIKILQDKSKLPLVIKDGKISVDRRDGYPKLYY
jgi:imidazolonepropionase-like amidohydrolase